MASLQLKNVVKDFGSAKVIRGVNLDVHDGEFVVFVGPSGCGKSTLLRMIAGLESASGGDIAIGETRVNDLPPRARDIAMVFQDYALYPHKSVFENMAFGLRLRKTPEAEIQRRVNEAAAILRIEHLLERKPRQLSGGQRQRVAMGRSIVRDPKCFLFDEPLSNLDAQLRNEMRTEIKKLHARLGKTIIYVTHDQVEAMTLANRIVIMRDGHVQQVGAPLEVYDRPVNLFVAGFIGSPEMNLIEGHASNGMFRSGALQIALPGQYQNTNEDVVLGIRPEHIALGEGPDALSFEVGVIEQLGAQTLSIGEIGGARLRILTDRVDNWSFGQKIPVRLQPGRLHLFSKETGQRI
mgnify:CR=1 FL=1